MKLARLGNGPEIFHTLQGEGTSVGMPAVFVRSSRCNLHCSWCDTDHTWNFWGTPWKHENDAKPGYTKHRKEDVTWETSPAEIASLVASYPCRRVIFTGGEPLLQSDGWLELATALKAIDPGYQFEIETNGTLIPENALISVIDQFNVSPKLANSGMADSLRIKPDALRALHQTGKAWFKFVLQNPSDLAEIESIANLSDIPKSRILLMPEGRNPEALQASSLWLAELCRDQGYRFCDRLHIRLWGDKRGV